MTRVAPRSAAASRQAPAGIRVTEAELQRAVVDLARSLGWGVTQSAAKAIDVEAGQYGLPPQPLDGLIYHPRYSLGSEPGWPDLTLVRRHDRRLIFAELKSATGVLGDRQVAVLELLRELEVEHNPGAPSWPSIEVHVWRPADLQSGAIAEVLR